MMNYRICAGYCGTTISIGEFETKEEAEELMKNPVCISAGDRFNEPEYVFPYEMWVEEILPFDEPEDNNPFDQLKGLYDFCEELPF